MSDNFVVCWDCSLKMAKWLQAWTNQGPSKRRKIAVPHGFYEYAGRTQ